METVIELMLFGGAITAIAGWAGCIIAIHRQDDDWAFWSFVFDAFFLFGAMRYWQQTRNSFLVWLVGIGIIVLSITLNAIFYTTA